MVAQAMGPKKDSLTRFAGQFLGYLNLPQGSQLKPSQGRKGQKVRLTRSDAANEAGDYSGQSQLMRCSSTATRNHPAVSTHHRNQQCDQARHVYEALASNKNLLVGAKALYWTAACTEKEGDGPATQRASRTLDARAPLSYYGFLGRQRFDGVNHRRIKRQALPVDYPLGRWSRSLRKDIRSELDGISKLARTGFIRFARVRFDHSFVRRLRRSLPKESRREAITQLRRLLEQWGAIWADGTRHVKRIPWNEGLADESIKDIIAAYPPAYLELARAAGRPYNVSPYWLLAQLQESATGARSKSRSCIRHDANPTDWPQNCSKDQLAAAPIINCSAPDSSQTGSMASRCSPSMMATSSLPWPI